MVTRKAAERLFTSESVTEGHPDKLCDQISDAILDYILERDPYARVACEVMAMKGAVVITGEISTNCSIEYADIARKVISEAGYNDPVYGFDAENCAVLVNVQKQSEDIALGVDHSAEFKSAGSDSRDLIGAGDQGMMYGYACKETPELMPAAIMYAHRLCRQMAKLRKNETIPWMRPDGKSQVTVQYGDDGEIKRVHTIVVSTQHDPDIAHDSIRQSVLDKIILPTIPRELIDDQTRFFINSTGRFVTGGPAADSGLTGRKIIVDTYGGAAAHGGGAFSGKDPTKVDRSGAYMARYIAKNIVAAGLASKCLVTLSYVIGMAMPASVDVNTMGTGLASDGLLIELAGAAFDLRVAGILDELNLRRPLYRNIATYGHFGRDDLNLPWENTEHMKSLIKL